MVTNPAANFLISWADVLLAAGKWLASRSLKEAPREGGGGAVLCLQYCITSFTVVTNRRYSVWNSFWVYVIGTFRIFGVLRGPRSDAPFFSFLWFFLVVMCSCFLFAVFWGRSVICLGLPFLWIFSKSPRRALGSTQPPLQWAPGALSPGVKRPGLEADHSPPASAEVKKSWISTSTPPYNFTFYRFCWW
jgi:hypothetical protein